MSKRRRTTRGHTRPIDKGLVSILDAVGGQTSTVIKTATFPCTFLGLRWSLSFKAAVAESPIVYWAIVHIREGYTASTMVLTDGAVFYAPEQNVLAYGVAHVMDSDAGTGPAIERFDGNTKTMRKLMVGDRVELINVSSTGTAIELRGVVQFFCKT